MRVEQQTRYSNKIAQDIQQSDQYGCKIEEKVKELAELEAISSEHQKTLLAITGNKDYATGPLAGVTPEDLQEAIDLQDVEDISSMSLVRVGQIFRFFKIMGVADTHAFRKLRLPTMRHNLLMLLFPSESDKVVKSAEDRRRKVIQDIKEDHLTNIVSK
jgi:hypothetical protein